VPREPARHSFTASTEAKDKVRNEFDYKIITDFRANHYPDRKLAYLGLPGEALLDILSWRNFIDRATAIEDTATRERLELNVLRNRLEGVVSPVYGNIDQLLGTEPGRQRLRWPYHIVNLDYCGGLIHARKRDDLRLSQRLDAISSLFSSGYQEETAFILFITLNLRDNDHGEMRELLDEVRQSLSQFGLQGVEECFAAHSDIGHAGELKIYLPIFLANSAKRHTLNFIPPILYTGTKTMAHFAVECIPYRGLAAGRINFPQDYVNMINLPLLALDNSGGLKSVRLGGIRLVPTAD
jgi:hypothetical protein